MTIKQLLNVPAMCLFKPLREQACIGYSQTTKKEIYLDPRGRHNLARVYLHELIHCRYPKMSEERVLYWEAKLWENVTYKEACQLYQRLLTGV